MNKEKLFELWGKVLKKDKKAKQEFKELYAKHYPKNEWIGLTGNHEKDNLHSAYLHLCRIYK